MERGLIKIVVNNYINILGEEEMIELKFYDDRTVAIKKMHLDPISNLTDSEETIYLTGEQGRDLYYELMHNSKLF